MWNTFRDAVVQLCPPDENALEAAQKLFREERLKKGEYFINEGQICTRMAFVFKGLFRSFYVNERGEEVTYCFAKEGGLETSFESFISSSPSSLSIIAMEDVEMLFITKDDLNTLLDTYLFWNKLSRILTETEYLKMTRHAAESKTELASIKYLSLVEDHPDLLQRVPLRYLASYLGISTRHLTRMRQTVAGHSYKK